MFQRTLDIFLLFVLAVSNNINLFPSCFVVVVGVVLFCLFVVFCYIYIYKMLFPPEKVRKMKLLDTDCPDLKTKQKRQK